MSFNLGQFRRPQLSSYVTQLTYNMIDIKSETEISQAIIFTDKAMELQGSSVLESGKNYYLKFKIYKRLDSEQNITVRLQNSTEIQDNIQTMASYIVAKGSGADYVTYEMILAPNGTYNQILFFFFLTSFDYTLENEDGTNGRVIEIEIDNFELVYNVIDHLNTILGITELKKIGVQGPPGLLMCINGEEIRIGRSGIYEINNGVVVTFIGFIVKQSSQTDDNLDYFILDYQY